MKTIDPLPAERNGDALTLGGVQNPELTSATKVIGESPGFNKFLRDYRKPLYNKYQQLKAAQKVPEENDCEFAQFTDD